MFLQKYIKEEEEEEVTMGLVKCKKCPYSWETTSKLIKVTCPSCKKTTNNNLEVEDAE